MGKSREEYKDYFKGRDWVHQLGFYAPNWKEFMTKHHEMFGSGPFYYTTNKFSKLLYHGEEVDCSNLEFRACYGAYGSHSVEVVEPHPFSVPTMYTDANEEGTPGFNHIHIFVEDLEEAIEACEALDMPVVTVGYADPENAIEKLKSIGASEEDIQQAYENAKHPSFVVVDMRQSAGCFVQLVTPRAKRQHDMLIEAKKTWDGDESTLFRAFGA